MRHIRQRSGFTLMELIIVVIILSILVSMGLVNYVERKKQFDYKSAIAQIKLISAGQKNYCLGVGAYVATASTAATNSILGISVKDGAFNGYQVVDVAPSGFNVSVVNSAATYKFDSNGTRLSCTGTGCIS